MNFLNAMVNLSNNFETFLKDAENAALTFKSLKPHRVRLVSHLDADGISSSAILVKMLNKEGILYNLSIVQKINTTLLNVVKKDSSEVVIFSDLGSGNLEEIKETLKDKKAVFILDHHEIELDNLELPSNIFLVNPHKQGIDGNSEISGSGVSYWFSYFVNDSNKELAYLAIIGAIGDIQENNGFIGLNEIIKQHAIQSGKLIEKPGLKIYGSHSRPLHKLLEYSTDPYIPGVSGSESNAIQFLKRLNIPLQNKDGSWKKFVDLSEDEKKRLISGLVMLLANTRDDPEQIIGPVYEITEEPLSSQLRDAREFATFLNACGRLGKASIGIAVCLNNERLKKRSNQVLLDYKKEIIRMMRWFRANQDNPEYVIRGNNYLIVNGKENIRHTMIGTFASILSKSLNTEDDLMILTLAQIPEENLIKASLRSTKENSNLKEIIQQISERLGINEFGGHKNAAGAFVPIEKEEQFLEHAQRVLSLMAIEEKID
ncbi:MAG: single-stranded-DNA-specific exonuclease [Candidatus Woesearchaeota archaeon]|nr:single-stranded-DNA-specific exonuclease [Candidatus Woesearchaeota archaeon]MDN5328026.1 single-stranded-DNA-specific exonuclease [Candidatus Woesearchaeota archaeon]